MDRESPIGGEVNIMKSYLEGVIERINKDQRSLDSIKAWIDGYEGKIITLKGSGGSYHIIFTTEGVRLGEGIYPSCEVYYEADDDVILNILQGKRSASSEVKSNRCKVRGSLNEASNFEKIIGFRGKPGSSQ
jgi:hypothetical protein